MLLLKALTHDNGAAEAVERADVVDTVVVVDVEDTMEVEEAILEEEEPEVGLM